MISYCNPKGSQLVRYWIYSSMVSQVGLNTRMMIEAKALESPSHMLNASIKSVQKIDVGLFVMVKEESVRNFTFKLIHIISVLIIVIIVHTVMISVVSKRQLSGVNPSVPIR